MITSLHTWDGMKVHYLTVMASKEAGQNILSVIFMSSLYEHMQECTTFSEQW